MNSSKELLFEDLAKNGVSNQKVLAAIKNVPREEFVPAELKPMAYLNKPLHIGHGQTISQPLIIGIMLENMIEKEGGSVLEIGTGSGYNAALLANLFKEVYTVERITELFHRAKEQLETQGFNNVFVKHGDGFEGWPEKSPFDVIVLTAAPPDLPNFLVEQLKPDGIIIAPIGEEDNQILYRYRNTPDGLIKEKICGVSFVPMKH